MLVVKKKFVGRFRNRWTASEYSDSEGNFPPSVVDKSDYESIPSIVVRMQRGEIFPRRDGVYDFEDDKSAMDAPLNSDFDLVDVSIIEQRERESKRERDDNELTDTKSELTQEKGDSKDETETSLQQKD